MAQASAGILMWRRRGKDNMRCCSPISAVRCGASQGRRLAIPKGHIEPGEEAVACARREFEEELGVRPTASSLRSARIRQKGGKQVEAFAIEGDLDTAAIVSNRFTIEWPPHSGRFESFAEIDRAAWLTLECAREKILPSQAPLLDPVRGDGEGPPA